MFVYNTKSVQLERRFVKANGLIEYHLLAEEKAVIWADLLAVWWNKQACYLSS